MSNRNTSGIEIDENGNTIVYESEREKDRRIRKGRLETIRVSITDEHYDPAEASRLIAVEIARVAEDLSDCLGDGSPGGLDALRLKVYEQQLRALRELGKQLNDADTLGKKDLLNIEGPKFIWMLEQIVDYFKSSMKESGQSEESINSVMKHFRDKMVMNEEKLRRDVQKIG